MLCRKFYRAQKKSTRVVKILKKIPIFEVLNIYRERQVRQFVTGIFYA